MCPSVARSSRSSLFTARKKRDLSSPSTWRTCGFASIDSGGVPLTPCTRSSTQDERRASTSSTMPPAPLTSSHHDRLGVRIRGLTCQPYARSRDHPGSVRALRRRGDDDSAVVRLGCVDRVRPGMFASEPARRRDHATPDRVPRQGAHLPPPPSTRLRRPHPTAGDHAVPRPRRRRRRHHGLDPDGRARRHRGRHRRRAGGWPNRPGLGLQRRGRRPGIGRGVRARAARPGEGHDVRRRTPRLRCRLLERVHAHPGPRLRGFPRLRRFRRRGGPVLRPALRLGSTAPHHLLPRRERPRSSRTRERRPSSATCPESPRRSPTGPRTTNATAQPESSRVSAEVKVSRWTGCAANSDVSAYLIAGGAHAWPGGFDEAGSSGIRATELIWEFFSEHTLLP